MAFTGVEIAPVGYPCEAAGTLLAVMLVGLRGEREGGAGMSVDHLFSKFVPWSK